MNRIELSALWVEENDVSGFLKNAKELKKVVEDSGNGFGLQFHNTAKKKAFEEILKAGITKNYSIHAPLFEENSMSLCYDSESLIKEMLQRQIEIAKKINASYFLFHGFDLSFSPLSSEWGKAKKTIKKLVPERLKEKTGIPKKEYFEDEMFKKSLHKGLSRLNLIKNRGLPIAIENDAAWAGFGIQRPQEIMLLDCPMCLDIGHLWVASLVNEFDFWKALRQIREKKQIIVSHLQSNEFTSKSDRLFVKDTHKQHLNENPELDFTKVIRELKKGSCRNFVVEMKKANKEDIELIVNALK